MALFLLENGHAQENVEIIFHYKFGSYNVIRYLKQFFLLKTLIRKKASKITLLFAPSKKKKQKKTVFDLLNDTNRGLKFETALGSIRLRKSISPLYKNVKDWLGANKKAFSLYLRCFNSKGFQPFNVLSMTYKGYKIGDNVASNALRRHPSSGGQLKRCKIGVLESVIDAVAFVNYSDRICASGCANEFVIVPEWTYLDGVYKSVFHNLGASVIEHQYYTGLYRIIGASEPLKNPKQAEYSMQPIDEPLEKRINNYLNQRVNNPSRHLDYMNKNIAWVNDLKSNFGREVKFDEAKVNIVLFLHSFDDAQYAHGVDGFEDLFDWVTTTIEVLSRNTDVGKILVKTHPNIEYKIYPGDKKAVKKLKSFFSSEKSLIWLTSSVTPCAISKIPNLVAITHHGSIAEEMVYLNVPVIASTYAPWGNAFNFVRAWSTPNQYKGYLSNIKNHVARVTVEEEKMLKCFVFEYRIKKTEGREETLWEEFHEYIFGERPKTHWDGIKRLQNYLFGSSESMDRFSAFVGEKAIEKM